MQPQVSSEESIYTCIWRPGRGFHFRILEPARYGLFPSPNYRDGNFPVAGTIVKIAEDDLLPCA